jgi:hypothetical protein
MDADVGNSGGFFMKPGTTLTATLFVFASLPLLAQQPPPANAPNSATPQQTTQPASPAAAPDTPAAPMSPVNGELVSKLDSKTAKTGDSVVVQTRSSIKTADGTEIPKGSKLIGHIIAVQPSAAGQNSQLALQFDRIELKGGQSLPVHSQIESIAPAAGSDSASSPSPSPMAGPASSSPNSTPTSPTPNGVNSANRQSSVPQGPGADPGAAAAGGMPAAGTVVAKNGSIDISTTAIPGVLLANNSPGQQDPRMAQTSSILVGARKDIQLDGGTKMVVGLSSAASGPSH